MLEIACFNTSSAVKAADSGADRIELCADYAWGGITPSLNSLHVIRKDIKIPINVMIRPRAGNFAYSTSELEQMKSDIQLFKPVANGFVFGILNEKNLVDEEKNRELVELAAPLPCTFHRAFDQVPDLLEATEQVIRCGFTSILTSGAAADAVSGAKAVVELHSKFGSKVTFILGGGVRSINIESLKRETSIEWYHSAAITKPGEDIDREEVQRLQTALKQVE
ncbi:hypothetical protein K469DRAFT_545338 [Zopfia rhizophila CBS 207.26]|uniref:Copper homeostasis protein cutC homolog n=1 Tax=Zopfia rhizophila CBS 207.26 TaxID=1314779 RepID=A0A6A6EVE2_9PEZI|nr:hypothetical protein K469DRAFT_545338 [Zopfia rhizophila CBS 207.26]